MYKEFECRSDIHYKTQTGTLTTLEFPTRNFDFHYVSSLLRIPDMFGF